MQKEQKTTSDKELGSKDKAIRKTKIISKKPINTNFIQSKKGSCLRRIRKTETIVEKPPVESKSKSFQDRSYLSQTEKEILDMWLTPSAAIEEKDSNNETKNETKSETENKYLGKKREFDKSFNKAKNTVENGLENDIEKYKLNCYINELMGFPKSDIRYLDFIDGYAKKVANRKMNIIDKNKILLKYLNIKKSKQELKNYWGVVKKEEEKEAKRKKDLEEDFEYIYEEEEEQDDFDNFDDNAEEEF